MDGTSAQDDALQDGTLARELLQDLRETRAKLEAAREDAASLKVLLALRTHQHDLAWQTAQRLESELVAARAAAAAAVEAEPEPAPAAPGDIEALARAREETEAVRTVLGAVLGCIGWRGLDRRRFKEIIARAAREVPDHGPGAARHGVLLAESRRVLGVPG